MEFSFRPIPSFSDSPIAAYLELFHVSFPSATKRFTADYLAWLYCENPSGVAVGFDAWDGEVLAAHYVCIPIAISLHGRRVQALLSLNTATHPKYQGQGLFTKLAEHTYDYAAASGFSCVVGVANASSTPGFLRKLGFSLVAPLTAKVGIGSFNTGWSANLAGVEFMRSWTAKDLSWRSSNPSGLVSYSASLLGVFSCMARSHIFGVTAYAEIPIGDFPLDFPSAGGFFSPLRVFIGSFPISSFPSPAYMDIPSYLRPSPLNFIFKPLGVQAIAPESGAVLLSFMDFDAY